MAPLPYCCALPPDPQDALSRRTAGARNAVPSFLALNIGGVAARACQERPVFAGKIAAAEQQRSATRRIGAGVRRHSGARATGLTGGTIGSVGVDVEWPGVAFNDLSRDHNLLNAFEARQIEHGVEEDGFHDRAQSARAGLPVDRLARDRRKRFFRQRQVHRLPLEHPLVLLHQRVLRFGEDALERGLIEIFQGRDHGKPAHELRNEPVLQQILRFHLAENLSLLTVLRRHHLCTEADRGRTSARRDDLFQPGKCAAADEQDIRGVDLEEFLLRMLAAALGRNTCNRAFHDLEQRLLHALAGNVAGDRGVVGFARYLVDLVDVDDAALCALDVVVGRLQQLQNDIFDVLADVAGFGERGCVRHRERHVEDTSKRLRQQRLAGTGRSDQENIRLRQLDVVVLALVVEPLVVIVDGDREHLFRVILADHVIIENLADLARRWNAVARLHQRGLVLLADDVHAQLDALVANEYGRPGNELAHLVLALAAKRAVERVLGIAAANFAHSRLRLHRQRRCVNSDSVLTAALTIRSNAAPSTRTHRPSDYTRSTGTRVHANGVPIKNPLTITRVWAGVLSRAQCRKPLDAVGSTAFGRSESAHLMTPAGVPALLIPWREPPVRTSATVPPDVSR